MCILVRQTEDGTLQLHCYLLWSPLFCPSLWSPLRPCHVFGQRFCDLHANNNTSIFLCVCMWNSTLCFPSIRGGKSWIMIRAFVPLDCVVAVADVGLLCWESWKRRMRGAIESPAESRLIIVTYEMRQAGAYIWTCFLSLTSVTYGIMAENECSGAVLSSCCSVAETIIISINSWDSSYISTLYYLHQRASVKPAAHPSTTSTSTTLSFNYQASTFQLSPQTV